MVPVQLAMIGIVVRLACIGASDPCFDAQRFGYGFDVATDDALRPSPHVDAGQLVAHVRYDSCMRGEFHIQFKSHETRGDICAVWFDRANESARSCSQGASSRHLMHEVRAPLPSEAGDCRTLLFAFPPGQRYEYLNLGVPIPPTPTLHKAQAVTRVTAESSLLIRSDQSLEACGIDAVSRE
mmetsp:Transcript_31529/g.61938  ORF Transcript_31529/g.61938 Transcript_31529/m.61938 type:complete len:182 (+) Transcript_31529:113-658(+)